MGPLRGSSCLGFLTGLLACRQSMMQNSSEPRSAKLVRHAQAPSLVCIGLLGSGLAKAIHGLSSFQLGHKRLCKTDVDLGGVGLCLEQVASKRSKCHKTQRRNAQPTSKSNSVAFSAPLASRTGGSLADIVQPCPLKCLRTPSVRIQYSASIVTIFK